VARDYIYWADWRFRQDEPMWGLIDGGLAVVFLVLAVGFFVAATRMWAVGPDAWSQSVRLLGAQIGLILLSIVLWGLEALDAAGLLVSCCLLVYLNLAAVRALFGRGPLFGPPGTPGTAG
jgi:hypothetical protein